MIQGLYTAASGMIAVERRVESHANNVANAATPGFKKQVPVQTGFYQTLSQELRNPFHYNVRRAPGGGVRVTDTHTNFSAGVLRRTENPLNLALQGPGYFVVDTRQGPRYTRSGDFTLNGQGALATSQGHPVQSANGEPITPGPGNIVVDNNGGIRVNGVPAGQLRVVEFEDPQRLRRVGSNLYRAPEDMAGRAAPAQDTRVAQKFIETSNVNVPLEMGQMMMGLRAYQANSRVMAAFDETMRGLIQRVAMPV